MIEQLQRLAELAPDVCQVHTYSDLTEYRISGYAFWIDSANRFCGSLSDPGYDVVSGRPALAWLADALERAIAARWDFEYRFFSGADTTPDCHSVEILNNKGRYVGDTKAAALLAALIKALEGKTE